MNCVFITERNLHLFEGLLPKNVLPGGEHLLFGAYDGEGYALGTIAATYEEAECSIEWLYVLPEARECGVATGLLECLSKAVDELGKLPITARFEAMEDNHLYDCFISQEQMDVDYLFDRYYVSTKALWSSPVLSKAARTAEPDTTISFFDCSDVMQRKILRTLAELPDSYGIEDYAAWKKDCIPELCRVALSGEEFSSCIFITSRSDGNLWLSYLYSANPVDMGKVVSSAAQHAMDLCPDASLVFDAVNDSSMSLASKFFPKASKVNIYEATV